jgi:crotonobetainyl-CoA:carnitine CoA-transferase CaiB-like acyl-CoA transferase
VGDADGLDGGMDGGMDQVLAGVRVVELATWTFVPACGAVLADWGADVVKVEHPVTGDPQRGLMMSGMVGDGAQAPVNFTMETPNRGKRSIGLDITSDAGRDVLHKLVAGADVFITSFLPAARRRLRVDVDDLRAINPRLIYARGHGQGVRGPEADRGGYDTTSFWARSGLANFHTPKDGSGYPPFHSPAIGDLTSGQTLAGGIAAALFRRERTGEPSVVDVSLLSVGMWSMAPGIVASRLLDIEDLPMSPHGEMMNPLTNFYRTKDGRYLTLIMLESDRYWAPLCEAIGRPELATDPRFDSFAARADNRAECIAILDEVFAQRTLDDWHDVLDGVAVWGPVRAAREVHDDTQALANGYLPEVEAPDGSTFRLVSTPVQFDEAPMRPTRSPEHGEQTEQVLLDLGYDWPAIVQLKDDGVVL